MTGKRDYSNAAAEEFGKFRPQQPNCHELTEANTFTLYTSSNNETDNISRYLPETLKILNRLQGNGR
jgi:hypothetical protein